MNDRIPAVAAARRRHVCLRQSNELAIRAPAGLAVDEAHVREVEDGQRALQACERKAVEVPPAGAVEWLTAVNGAFEAFVRESDAMTLRVPA